MEATTPCAAPIPIIDAHIHLFDTTRPQGVPWPKSDDPILYQPALPDRYQNISGPLNVVGAIAVECSPWLDDNHWLLHAARQSTCVVGVVGNLQPGTREFGDQLEELARDPLFKGIRCGNLWGRSMVQALSDSQYRSDLQLLSQMELELDVANPNSSLLSAVLRITDVLPDLRITIDHLPSLPLETKRTIQHKELWSVLNELGNRGNVFGKLSEVLMTRSGGNCCEASFYYTKLDTLWDVFGEDRLLFGSDWPNSDTVGPYRSVLGIVRAYLDGKDATAKKKVLWSNSAKVYRWHKRTENQPSTA